MRGATFWAWSVVSLGLATATARATGGGAAADAARSTTAWATMGADAATSSVRPSWAAEMPTTTVLPRPTRKVASRGARLIDFARAVRVVVGAAGSTVGW